MTTISANSTIGIYISSPSYTDPVVINPGVTISVTSGYAVGVFASAWTLQNNGTVISTGGVGIYMYPSGVVTNAASAVISGIDGVDISASGTVINAGTIAGTMASSIGVLLAAGGSVTNQAGGTISGYTGVDLTAGGMLTNVASASITGVYEGVEVSGAAGTVINSGSITGAGLDGIGVWLAAGGSVTNAATASIIGQAYGVELSAGGTLIDAGTIIGDSGTAIAFGGSGSGLLVLEPGYALSGIALGLALGGTNATTVLDLASATSTGTLSGLGTKFVDFAQITVGAGASWLLNGTNTIEAGTTLTEAAGATLTVSGTLLVAGALIGSGLVDIPTASTVNAQGAVAAGETLALAGSLALQTSAAAEIMFNTGGVLSLAQPASFSGTIDNFKPGDTIVLSQESFSSAGTATLLAGNTLQIIEDSQTIDLRLDPTQNYTGATFNLSLDANDAGTDITVLGPLLSQAIATLNTPGPFTLANQHVGATPLTKLLSFTNAATAPAEGLDVSIAGTTGLVTATGSVSLLAAGATNSSAISLGINDSTAGAHSGSVTLDEDTDGSQTDGAGQSLIGTATVTISGNVYNYATASTVASVNLGDAHVGATLSGALSISNIGAAGSFTEALDAAIQSSSGSLTPSGSLTGLAAGATNASAIDVSLKGTTKAGVKTGTVVLALTSDGGTGSGSIDGLGTTALTAETITVTGTLFNEATASAVTKTVSLGIVHVGQTVTSTLSISNTGTANGFTEALDAGFVSNAGAITATGTVHELTAAGTAATSLVVGLVTSQAGTISGTATLGLVSDGTGIDTLGTTALTSQTITVSGTVNNYATAQIVETSGGGTFSQSGNAYTLNLGTLEIGATPLTIDLAELNAAQGPADLLEGNYTIVAPSGTDPFVNQGFAAFSSIAAGISLVAGTIVVDPTQAGSFSETITLYATGYNASGYAGTLGVEVLTITEQTVACFLRGTLILTENGDVPVESLQKGDLVITGINGRTAPVIWAGSSDVDCGAHPTPKNVWPVRISAGAFGPGMPKRSLTLSPDHSVYIDQVLVPVKYLINGTTIAQMKVNRVTYCHVELPRHDVLLAEGMPTESFLDLGNKANFADCVAVLSTHTDLALDWEVQGCAPLVVRGPKLQAVRALVAARETELERDGLSPNHFISDAELV